MLDSGDCMEIRFHEKLYKDKISELQMMSIRRKVRSGSSKLNLFLITLPMNGQGVLEIYWYPELLQDLYRKMDVELVVVGLAWNRKSAFRLVKRIVEEVNLSEAGTSVRGFFEENR